MLVFPKHPGLAMAFEASKILSNGWVSFLIDCLFDITFGLIVVVWDSRAVAWVASEWLTIELEMHLVLLELANAKTRVLFAASPGICASSEI